MKQKIQELAQGLYEDVVAYRRYLHTHPELSFQEHNTSRFIKSTLDSLGIAWDTMANTGVVGIIRGEKPSEAVLALRADIDALPIQEANAVAYRSRQEGVMHACGHDAHTASLLGAAAILHQLRSEFGGVVKLVFQPAEEKVPGGALQMMKEGVLEQPRPQAVLGQHVMPSIRAGQVGVRSGRFMASNDEVYITVRGRGGHGAQPQLNTDPVVIAAHILLALQQIVSREADPKTPTVLSFGKVVANGAVNVIPDEATLEGTFRTTDELWRGVAHRRIREVASGIAACMGASCDVTIVQGYPCLINEDRLTAMFKSWAEEYLGEENVLEADVWMASEDFAYYAQAADACFYLLGVGAAAQGQNASLHTPTFDIDEQALETGAGLMAFAALRCLGMGA
ncbi:M20 family metallopeptidase [Pontibacter korlensis]|uniref:N-acyl-L-amino acid amidohydrolase n=1 Tax=Pontibacter korlensis TaxID=400092 RepID=A0A0E3UZI1_9BACT|nr:M20 family metallopeptidase [Pontibacter korlensis]AKD05376.1 N-acyl-L-amino acid amidohydrolase [Pontibacter korlensis]